MKSVHHHSIVSISRLPCHLQILLRLYSHSSCISTDRPAFHPHIFLRQSHFHRRHTLSFPPALFRFHRSLPFSKHHSDNTISTVRSVCLSHTLRSVPGN